MTVPSLATLARRVLDEAKVPHGASVVVACSGGIDSQVLLDVLAHVARPKRGKRAHAPPSLRLIAVGIDHGLRPEAADELALAAALSSAREIPFRKVELSVGRGGNLQARARDARYDALRRIAASEDASFIATGHQLEDRAETVIIRILRGAPVEGLAVLAPASQDLLRPLIRASRAHIESHAQHRNLEYASDPSNADRRHLRVRVREEVLPLLRSLDPRIVDHLAALADGAELARVVLGAGDRSAVPVISARAPWRVR